MDNTKQEQCERLVEAAVAVLEATPEHCLNIVPLNKALFFLDLLSLYETGSTVTKNTYVALPMGPVIAKYDRRLVPELARRNLAVQEDTGRAKPVRLIGHLGGYRYLDDEARTMAAKVAAKLCRMTSYEASDRSHDNPGWKLAYEAGLAKGKPAVAIDMNIALQGLLVEDGWFEEDLGDELKESLTEPLQVAEIW